MCNRSKNNYSLIIALFALCQLGSLPASQASSSPTQQHYNQLLSMLEMHIALYAQVKDVHKRNEIRATLVSIGEKLDPLAHAWLEESKARVEQIFTRHHHRMKVLQVHEKYKS